MTKKWFFAFVGCALLALAADRSLFDWPAVYAAAKPITLVLVIAFALDRGGAQRRRAVLVALGFSLVGDIALLWPREGFLPGLVAFLLAHLAYLYAFTRGQRFAAAVTPFVGYAVVAGVILALLWPGVPGALRLPVLAYVIALSAMAAQAAVGWWLHRAEVGTGTALARRAALGGALFVLSDAMLATNRFGITLPMAALWILPAYWAAQWLIASSLPARDD